MPPTAPSLGGQSAIRAFFLTVFEGELFHDALRFAAAAAIVAVVVGRWQSDSVTEGRRERRGEKREKRVREIV